MYEAFFGFREKPFSLLPDPDYLYLSDQHQMAMTLLEYGLENQAGFCVITGSIGTGKTTLIRHLLSRIGNDISVGLITNTHQSFGELLRWILHAFNLDAAGKSRAELHQALSDYLIAQYAKNRRTMIIVDEAQNMSPAGLEELRMLSNINSEKDLVLQIMLVGQPGLRELLQRPELEQLTQRVAVDYHLKPLNSAETRGYIRHRVAAVGGSPELFSDAACAAVFHYSRGTPRLINLLCDLVLVYAYAEQVSVVSRELVDQVVRERRAHGVLPIFAAGAAPAESPREAAASVTSAAGSRVAPADANRSPGSAAMPVPATRPAQAHGDVRPVDTRANDASRVNRAKPLPDPNPTTAAPMVSSRRVAAGAPAGPAAQSESRILTDRAFSTPVRSRSAPSAERDAAIPRPSRGTFATGVGESSAATEAVVHAPVPRRSTRRLIAVAAAAAALVAAAASVAWWLYTAAPRSSDGDAAAVPATSNGSSADHPIASDPQPGTTEETGPTPRGQAESAGDMSAAPGSPPTNALTPGHDAAPAEATPRELERNAPVTAPPQGSVPEVRVPASPESRAPSGAVDAVASTPLPSHPGSGMSVDLAPEPPTKAVAEVAPPPVVTASDEAPAPAPPAASSEPRVSVKAAEPATEFATDPCKGPAARFLSTCR